MSRDSNGRDRRTRRAYIGASGALLGGAFLAGCTNDGTASGTTDPPTETDANADGATPTASEATDATANDGEPYTVSMSPMGEVTFDGVPEDLFTVFTQYADMVLALGRGADVNAVYVPAMSGTKMNRYYARLDGVAFEWEGLVDPLSDGLPKERLYALDSDVHFADPAWASTQNNWDEGDVEEVTRETGPWFGNFYSGTNAPGPAGYEAYEHYTLWEIFGKVAAVLQERERYEALETIREEVAALADPSGSFVVRCGRTGQRPVPVDARRFPDRDAAARSALLTTEYRTRLRFWDDRTPYCDPIAHEERNGEGVCGADGGDACGDGSNRYPTSLVERVRAATDDGDRTGYARTHGSADGGDCDEDAAEE